VIRDLVRTALTGGAVTGLTTALGPVVIGLSLKDEALPDPVLRFWARGILAAASVRDEVHGLENLPGLSCVLACNHQSHFDSLVILANVPKHIRFVAKAELFKIPVFGQAMTAVGNVKVDRTGGENDRRAMSGAIEAVQGRTSILFFAEGTRSEDGVLGRFKKGAAMLALQAGVPLVPMAVAGTKDILTKGSRFVHAGKRAALCIGEAIDTGGMTPDDRDALTARARQAVELLYAEAQRYCGESPSP
jgi:1-acyl-sn-glycerol-3-phosphate acyltransferase